MGASSFCLLAFSRYLSTKHKVQVQVQLTSTSEYSLVFILVIIEGIIIEVLVSIDNHCLGRKK